MWSLMRVHPNSLQSTTVDTDVQYVPGWSGFNAMLYPEMPRQSNIGYCPMIDGSSTEFSTIYTVLKHAQMLSSALGQRDAVITFDLLIYMKAKQIQWKYQAEFSNVVIGMGAFHISYNYLALIGKMYRDSGIEDLFIESGVYAAGSTASLMKGKSFNRGIRAHKLVSEAMFRLMWMAFIEWYSKANSRISNEEKIIQSINSGINAVRDKGDVPKNSMQLRDELEELMKTLDVFKSESRVKSKMFAFWEQYCDMINALLQVIKAERSGNWDLYLSSLIAITPDFYAMDRPNYSRWLPVYIEDMRKLKVKHPQVYEEFSAGNFSISRSGHPFSQVAADMALEQSINADSKSKGGIVGISQSPAALERWFLTAHARASVTTAMKDMYGEEDHVVAHKEATQPRIKRDEGDVRKLIGCFKSGLMTNPFDSESQPIANLSTGVVLPDKVADALLAARTRGKEQMLTFIEKRLNTNDVSFWEAIPNLKVKTFTSTTKKVKVKASDEKIITVSADRELFGRLLIVANARQVNLKEVMSYELSPIPYALTHQDGSLRKTTKSQLADILEKLVDVSPHLQSNPNNTVYVIDGMAIVQMVKSANAATFGELAGKYYDFFTAALSSQKCKIVHVVFDQYIENSIKSGERSRRGTSSGLEVIIRGPHTPVPKQWNKYITNPKNKTTLCDFITNSMCSLAKGKLPYNTKLIVGGGFKDGTRCVAITRDAHYDIDELRCDHEEADTRILFHVKYSANPDSTIVIQSPDTDVLVLSVSHFSSISNQELWFRTGVKDRLRFVPVHDMAQRLDDSVIQALPAFHAITGCDSVSSISGIGKMKAWKAMFRSKDHQDALSHLGVDIEISNETIVKCEAFMCSIYPSNKRNPKTADELRYLMFCLKKQRNELLPPTSDCLRQHIIRANYQAYIWRQSLNGMQTLPTPQGHGWEIEDETLVPLLMTKEAAPVGHLELTTCSCKRSGCRQKCSCANAGLACTEACGCMADESCCNPHGLVDWDEEEEDQDNHSDEE